MEVKDRSLYVAILAAGKSTRMKSKTNKVMHKLAGRPILSYVLDTARALKAEKIFVVISPTAQELKKTFTAKDITFVVQDTPLGTGDATLRLKNSLERLDADIMILPGDAPLLRKKTARRVLQFHRKNRAAATVITADHPEPGSYGRIVRSEDDRLQRIVEAKDASPKERAICEINSGMYLFDAESLFRSLPKVKRDNKQREYYLTDVIEILQKEGKTVIPYKIADWREILGVNTRQELARANRILGERIKQKWMEAGVTFVDPDSVYVEYDVKIGADTIIYPFVSLLGKTVIGPNAVIGPLVVLKDTRVKEGEQIAFSVEGSVQ